MTGNAGHEKRVPLQWRESAGHAEADHEDDDYQVKVDLVGASGGDDWEWQVWVKGAALFEPRLAQRMAPDRATGLASGKAYAEHLAFEAERLRRMRAEGR